MDSELTGSRDCRRPCVHEDLMACRTAEKTLGAFFNWPLAPPPPPPPPAAPLCMRNDFPRGGFLVSPVVGELSRQRRRQGQGPRIGPRRRQRKIVIRVRLSPRLSPSGEGRRCAKRRRRSPKNGLRNYSSQSRHPLEIGPDRRGDASIGAPALANAVYNIFTCSFGGGGVWRGYGGLFSGGGCGCGRSFEAAADRPRPDASIVERQ